MNASVSGSDGGGLIVIEGPGLDLPEIPSDPVERVRGRCRIKVTLLAVYYGGDNVGSSWIYDLAVDPCGGWRSEVRTVPWRTTDPVNQVVCDTEVEHTCGLSRILSFFIRARELDWFIFDDIGMQIQIMEFPCHEELIRQHIVISVPVSEYPANLWRRIFRKPLGTALLQFYFEVVTQCVI
jgi:hypothetical protein